MSVGSGGPGEQQVLRTNLGSYALYAPVASGGFGMVYFGRDLRSNRAVAIKRLHGHLAYQPDVVARFQQEAKRLRGLQHPNIVQVLDDGTDVGGVPFIILQWVEGWTVGALLEQSGRFAIAEAVEIAYQVLAALQAAGERGVVHRDIKPANLMLTPPPDRQVKVMDFGIAKDVLANASNQYTQIGTIAYMAPEQFTEGPVDARTDLFALGVTLYEMLTGQRPNGALTAEAPNSLRQLRPEVDAALAAVVYRALEKRPDDRFESAAQMRTALQPFVGRGTDLTILGGGALSRSNAPDPGASLGSTMRASPTGDSVPSTMRASPTGDSVPSTMRASPTGDSVPSTMRFGPTGDSVPSTMRASPTGDSVRPTPRGSPTTDGGSGRQTVGAAVWVVSAAAVVAVLAIVGAVVLQTGGWGTPQTGDSSPALASLDVATPPPPPPTLALALAPVAPATANPALTVAAAPATLVQAATAATATPAATPTAAPTLTIAPTATPTVDDLWQVALAQLEPTWSHDWPGSIAVLRAFLAAHPGFAAGQEKLYAAYLFYADELLATGDVDGAIQQLEASTALLPDRVEAKQTLVALTPVPTPTTAPAAVVPKPQATLPTQPRTQPTPVQRAPAQQPPAPPAPAQQPPPPVPLHP
jgi:serine/threonine-protein kinase